MRHDQNCRGWKMHEWKYREVFFEEAPARAVRQVFGNDVVVSGFWFHYAQALVKRLRKIGLTDSYNSHQETQTIFRALMALPLLPMADIRPAFDDVKSLLHHHHHLFVHKNAA